MQADSYTETKRWTVSPRETHTNLETFERDPKKPEGTKKELSRPRCFGVQVSYDSRRHLPPQAWGLSNQPAQSGSLADLPEALRQALTQLIPISAPTPGAETELHRRAALMAAEPAAGIQGPSQSPGRGASYCLPGTQAVKLESRLGNFPFEGALLRLPANPEFYRPK